MLLLVSEESPPFFADMAGGLGERLRLDVTTTPGTHAAYHDHPRELAEAVRPFLRKVTATRPEDLGCSGVPVVDP